MRLTTGTQGRRCGASSLERLAEAVRRHAHHEHVGPAHRLLEVGRWRAGSGAGRSRRGSGCCGARSSTSAATSAIGGPTAWSGRCGRSRWATVVPHEPATDHRDPDRACAHPTGPTCRRRSLRSSLMTNAARAGAGEGVRARQAAPGPGCSTRPPGPRWPARWPSTVLARRRRPARGRRVRRRRGARRGPTSAGAEVIWRPGRGLNGAVADGVAHARPPTGFDRGDRRPRRPPPRHSTSPGSPTSTASRSCPTATTTAPTWRRVPTGAGLPLRLRRRARSPATAPRPPASACALRVVREPRLGWDVDVPADLRHPPTGRPRDRRPSDRPSTCPTPARGPGHRRPPRRRRVRLRRHARQVGGRRAASSTTSVCTDGSKGTWDPDDGHRRAGRQPARSSSRPRPRPSAPRRGACSSADVDGELDVRAAPAVARSPTGSGALQPDVVLGHDPWKRYRLHPDHRHAGLARRRRHRRGPRSALLPRAGRRPPPARRAAAVRGRRARPRRGRHRLRADQARRAARAPQPVRDDDAHHRRRTPARSCRPSATASSIRCAPTAPPPASSWPSPSSSSPTCSPLEPVAQTRPRGPDATTGSVAGLPLPSVT